MAVERIHRYYKNYIHTGKMDDKRANWNHNFLKQNQINQLQQQVPTYATFSSLTLSFHSSNIQIYG